MNTRAFLMMGFAILAVSPAMAQTPQYNRGGVRSDGTYVQPHMTTKPDGNRFNNWSTQGNVNPYTGRSGTVDPYATPAPRTPGYGQSYGTTGRRR